MGIEFYYIIWIVILIIGICARINQKQNFRKKHLDVNNSSRIATRPTIDIFNEMNYLDKASFLFKGTTINLYQDGEAYIVVRQVNSLYVEIRTQNGKDYQYKVYGSLEELKKSNLANNSGDNFNRLIKDKPDDSRFKYSWEQDDDLPF